MMRDKRKRLCGGEQSRGRWHRAIGTDDRSTAVRWGSPQAPIFSKLVAFHSAAVHAVQGLKSLFSPGGLRMDDSRVSPPPHLKTEAASARAAVSLAI